MLKKIQREKSLIAGVFVPENPLNTKNSQEDCLLLT